MSDTVQTDSTSAAQRHVRKKGWLRLLGGLGALGVGVLWLWFCLAVLSSWGKQASLFFVLALVFGFWMICSGLVQGLTGKLWHEHPQWLRLLLIIFIMFSFFASTVTILLLIFG